MKVWRTLGRLGLLAAICTALVGTLPAMEAGATTTSNSGTELVAQNPAHIQPTATPADTTTHSHFLGCKVTMKMLVVLRSGSLPRQARGKVACDRRHKPRRFDASIEMMKKHGTEWLPVGGGPDRREIPYPFRFYWINKPCRVGTYAARLAASGTNAAGHRVRNHFFTSGALHISDCVSGGPAVAVTHRGQVAKAA